MYTVLYNMNEPDILTIISKYNPWWTGSEIPKLQLLNYKRRFFYTLTKEFETREITSILGPRRVGKTVLIHQLIKSLIDKGIPPVNILYISLDHSELRRDKIGIREVLETYYKLLLKKPLEISDEKVYVFLDEIQSVEDWHKILKNIWDLKYNIKFFVSGSSTMALSKGAMESLLGRIRPFTILPFKFSEVLEYNKIIDKLPSSFLRDAFMRSILKGDPKILFEAFNEVLGSVIPVKEKIEILLNRYFIVGGYPEFLDIDNYAQISQTIQEKLRFTFYQDIVRFFKVRNANILDDLFAMIAASSGTKTNIMKTSHDLDIQRPTLKSYIEHFRDIFLISQAEFFSKSRRHRSRKNKKIYVNDTGIRNASLGVLGETVLQDARELGSVVECFVFDHLKRLKFILEPSPDPKLFYWDNKKEVDFVFEFRKNILSIEVKYKNSISDDDTLGTNEFMKNFNATFGIILSKDTFELRRNILIIPIWLFILII